MPSFYQKNGYDVQITIGTTLLTTSLSKNQNGLCDDLTITGICGQSRTATFSFIPPEDVVNLTSYEGKPVKILLRTPADGWQQVFSGNVDEPRIDFITRKINLVCTDNRQNRIIQLATGVVDSIGSYSEAVFGVSKDQAEELEKRLSTVQGDFDFDRFGKYALTSWTPKTTADYTLNSSDISDLQAPTLEFNSTSKSINTITIKVNYTYTRLHQQHVAVSWAGYSDFMRDYWNAGKPSFPARTTIDTAANGNSWKVVGGVNYDPLWPAQGFSYGTGYIIWQPNQINQVTAQRTTTSGYLKNPDGSLVLDSNNKPVRQTTPVTDKNGKPIMDVVSSTVTDTSSGLCKSASWVAAKRFAQSITEQYTLTISAPQAVARYGTIKSEENVSIDSPYDASTWESTDAISSTIVNFYVDQKSNASTVNEAAKIMLAKAKTSILSLYRNYIFTVRTKYLRPKLDLWNTLSINVNESARGASSYINAKGKVYSLTHNINFNTLEAYSTVAIKLSRSAGSSNNTAWTIPVPVQNPSYIYNTLRAIGLQTYIAQDPDSGASSYWKGWVCNGEVKNASTSVVTRTTYPEYFVLDYPEIPESLRKEKTYTAASTYNISIPNDFLEVSF